MWRNVVLLILLCLLLDVYAGKPKSDFFKIRVAQWNIGQLSKGKKRCTAITHKEREAKAKEYSRLINDVRADIFCVSEYAPFFSLNDNLQEDSTFLTHKAIFSIYPECAYGERYGANCNFIAVAYGAINKFTTVDYKTKQQHRYYSSGEIKVNGVKVKLVSTHLDIPQYVEERKTQAVELLSILRNEPYVILCADFNMLDTSEYDIFKKEGFCMANHGVLGDLVTFPNKEGGYCLDNIICKGFSIMGVDVYKTQLSDHYVIAAELLMK